jgi:hypothetical protein
VGAMRDPDTGQLTYSGHLRGGFHPLNFVAPVEPNTRSGRHRRLVVALRRRHRLWNAGSRWGLRTPPVAPHRRFLRVQPGPPSWPCDGRLAHVRRCEGRRQLQHNEADSAEAAPAYLAGVHRCDVFALVGSALSAHYVPHN